MKLIATATILSLLAVSTSAASLRTTTTKSRQLRNNDNDNKRNNDVERGEPSFLEFENGGCIGFDREEEGEEAVVVDCDDNPSLIVYRNDQLLELENNNDNLCLKADNDKVVLDECNDDDDEQKWFFVLQVIKRNRVYRICNVETRDCMERDGDDVDLQRFDGKDKDQLVKELDSDFFDTD